MKSKNIQHYSRLTDKGPSIAERLIKTIRNFLKKPVSEKGNADWLSELPSVIRKNKFTIHSSIKMSPNQTCLKKNEKEVYSKIQARRARQQPKIKLGDLIRTSDIKRVFSKGDGTNYSYKIYTITGIIHDTIASYRIDYLPERYNQSFLLSSELSLEQNIQFMKKLNLIQ